MRGEMILILLRSLPWVASALLVATVLILSSQGRERKVFTAYVELGGMLREKSLQSRWYKRRSAWLVRNGVTYHYGKWAQPTSMLALEIILGLAGFVALLRISPWIGMMVSLGLAVLPEILLVYMNKQDNLKLLPEIKLVYHALELQIRAGVYVTDALAECYGSVQEPRLKQALLDLAGDIVMKADIYDALDRFQTKFENRYIDSLCITILQALESGQAVELLGDIAEQIKDMEGTVLERQKASLDRSITFYQLGVLTAVMGVVLYACVTHMYSAALAF